MANTGLKNYTKQFTQSVGNAGEVNINLRKNDANFILTLPIISTGGTNPIDISLIYNHQDNTMNCGYGNGIRPSFYRKRNTITGQSITLTNADGSTDVFLNSNGYKNEDTCETVVEHIRDYVNYFEYLFKVTGFNYETRHLETNTEFPYMITTNANTLRIDTNSNYILLYNATNNDYIKILKDGNYYTTYICMEKEDNVLVEKYRTEVDYSIENKITITKKIDDTILSTSLVEFNSNYIIVEDQTSNIGKKYLLNNNVVEKILEKLMVFMMKVVTLRLTIFQIH